MRRNKEETQDIRHELLEATGQLFQQQGMSRAGFKDIAKCTVATRDAIDWHFMGWADLFDDTMKRTTLPLERCVQRASFTLTGTLDITDPMSDLRLRIDECLSQIVNDMQTALLDIANLRTEYRTRLSRLD